MREERFGQLIPLVGGQVGHLSWISGVVTEVMRRQLACTESGQAKFFDLLLALRHSHICQVLGGLSDARLLKFQLRPTLAVGPLLPTLGTRANLRSLHSGTNAVVGGLSALLGQLHDFG